MIITFLSTYCEAIDIECNDHTNIIYLDIFKQMAYDAKYLRIPEIRWLGAFPSDSENYQLPQQCLLNLTAEGEMLARECLLLFMKRDLFN